VNWLLLAAFALIMAGEIALLIVVGSLLALVPYLLWERSPLWAILVVAVFVATLLVLWLLHRAESPTVERVSGGPQITLSRIPVSGTAGLVYMTQFLVWALLSPAVGVLYALLLSGALLARRVVRYMHRPGRPGYRAAAGAALLGGFCGVAVAGASIEQAPLGRILLAGVLGGAVAAPILLWIRSRARPGVTIAPYANNGS